MLLFSWENLSLLSRIYWIIAISSTVVFVILLLFSFFGAEPGSDISGTEVNVGDVHSGDVGIADGFSGFIISFKSIMSFLMMFGWAGILSQSYKLSTIGTLLIAFITGFVALFAVAGLLFFVTRMTQSGTLKMENAIGKSGQVILKIPPKKQGFGQIQINIQGGLQTLDAVCEEAEEIKSGSNVMVIDLLEDNTLLVVPKR